LPLGCVINKRGIEIYMETLGKLHSIAFFNSPLNLGLWEIFSPPTPFSISAGARSLMLLPKISDNSAHANLKSCGVSSSSSCSPFGQWQIFREIASHANQPIPWRCEVLFFTKKWIDIMHSPAGIKLRYYLLNKVWEQTEYNRNRFLYDEMWESFFRSLSHRRIKPISYIIDIFRHLIALASCPKTTVAYKPASSTDTAGPIDQILRVYLEVYKLKTYAPTIMIPCHFLADNSKDAVYYPIQNPTCWDSAPKSRDSISAKKDLECLVWLLDAFQNELKHGNVNVCIPGINEIFDKVNFDFFHSDGNLNDRIQPSSNMPLGDKNLVYLPGNSNQYGERKFADRSSFARSCIRISLKQNSTITH
ncbi:MAG: hypothetical protein ACD_69C00275G0002, partial [uncultured bacterium]